MGFSLARMRSLSGRRRTILRAGAIASRGLGVSLLAFCVVCRGKVRGGEGEFGVYLELSPR